MSEIAEQWMMIQMVDRPNTTPIGQDKKTLTFKANKYVFQRPPFSVWKQERFFIDSLLEEAHFLLTAIYS